MNTPIIDFIKDYSESNDARFHMPGHKGRGQGDFYKYDITEIEGADVLYSPSGIIEESENNASSLFSTAHSFYSAEGSSLSVRAMLSMVCEGKEKPVILAGRNAHKVFLYAAALLDFEICWLYGSKEEHICKCSISGEDVKKAVEQLDRKPAAVYVTSPDYLGNILDIKEISCVCDSIGVPLLVDNAHGAYLAFLPQNLHPIALGASMCCDSAHKTLPCLTGGAYLHIGEKAKTYVEKARRHLSVFSSTSPSYIILQSLDFCNRYLSENFKERLFERVQEINRVKSKLGEKGITFTGDEPLKLSFCCNDFGYEGKELYEYLASYGIISEYYDREYLVLMLSAENTKEEIKLLMRAMSELEIRKALSREELPFPTAERVMSVRQAMFSESEYLPTELCENRVCASPSVSCPPAVPVVVSGELIGKQHIALMKHYGTKGAFVVKRK